ncbi:MAG: oligosaccharide flippase family protein [bacterium]|nr:oligosaccharide flippase family protein [bacterium]
MSKLIKNTFIYTIGNIIPQAGNFLLLPIYTKFLSPGEYGIVASMAVLNSILVIFFTLCSERSIYRLFFDYHDGKEQKDFLGTIFLFEILFASAAMALCFVFHNWTGRIYRSIPFYPYYAYSLMTGFLLVFSFIPLINFQVKEKAVPFVLLSVCQFIINSLLILWFVVKMRAGASGQLKGAFISGLILLPVYLFFVSRTVNLTINSKMLKNALLFSIPLIPSLITAWVLNLSNRIFLERYFNLTEVGIYSFGFKLGTLGLIVISGFMTAYSPYFFKLASQKEDQAVNKRKLQKANNSYALVVLLLIFAIALFLKEIVYFFMDSRYAESYVIARIIVLAYFFSGLSSLASLSIMQAKRTKQMMVLTICEAIINVILNFILIPSFGMYGAAFSALLTFIFGYLIEYQYSKRCYFVPLNWRLFFSCLGIIGGIIILYQFFLEKWLLVALISKVVLCGTIIYFIGKKVITFQKGIKLNFSKIFEFVEVSS